MSSQERKSNFSVITGRVRDVGHQEERVALLRGLSFAGGSIFGIVLLAAVIEALFHLPPLGRTILFIITLLAVTGMLGWHLVPPLLRRAGLTRRADEDDIALKIGDHFPHLKDRLLNALQVYRDAKRNESMQYSMALADASFDDVAHAVSRLDFSPVVDTKPVRSAARKALYSFVFSAALFAMFPAGLPQSVYRILHFNRPFLPPAPFSFVVEPGTKEVVKGETIPITIRLNGQQHAALSLYLREEEQTDFDHLTLTPDSTGLFHYTVENIRGTIHYYASVMEYQSTEYVLKVVDRPLIRNLRIQLTYPAYTKIPPRYLEDNTGEVTALAGTYIDFDLTLNKDVASASILFSDSEVVRMTHREQQADARVRLMKSRSYSFELVDEAGIRNMNPITYSLTVVPDLPPTIRIIEPGISADLSEDMRLPMLMNIADDFGFSRIRLGYRLSASKFEKPAEEFTFINIPLPINPGTESDVPFIWNCSSLDLVPEDVVTYFVEVFDNDAVNGPKSARSDFYTLRLPSMEEVFARADKTQEQALDELKKSLSEVEKMQREMEEVERDLKKSNMQQLDWQQKKKIEEIMKRQEELTKKVEDVTSALSRMTEDMQQHNLISEETVRKYQELQELMKEMDLPEFEQAMKRLQEAMKNISPEMMKQALENFQFSEEMFKQSIERTMELLKRLQIEQKVDELAKRSEELANKQEELRERTENANPNDAEEMQKLAREQEELRKEAEAMQRELDELRKKMEEFPEDMPLGELQDAQSELNLSQMQQQISQAAGMCQGGNKQGASQQQKKSAEQLQRFQKKMSQVKKKLQENQDRVVMNAFRKALQNILELSKRQEALKNESADLPPNSPQFREAQQEQQQLSEQLQNLANDLMKLSKKTFSVTPEMGKHIGRAMQQMQQSMQNMEQRNGDQSRNAQTGAMGELNEAAKKIAQAMQSQSGGQGGGMSLMQQLQRMAAQQQAVNMGTQQLGQGEMSEQQRAQLQRLIGQQAALQKSLEQLEQEARNSKEGNKVLGDLNKIGEEMQEVVRDMQQQNINPETIQRQERILSRLLDASRSTRERDYERKRRAETGTDVARRSPTEIDPNALDERTGIQRDLQKAIQEGYNKDYEELIRKYFDSLQKMNLQGNTP